MSRFGIGFHGYNAEIAVPGNDSYTKVLLHMDGVNGGTSFPDVNAGGVPGRVWTSTTSPASVTSSANKKFGSSAYKGAVIPSFGSPGSFISTPYTSDFDPSSDFTFDFRFNMNGVGGVTQMIAAMSVASGASGPQWQVFLNSSNRLFVSLNQSSLYPSVQITSSSSYTGSDWHFAKIDKSGSSLFLSVDGASEGNASIPHAIPTSDGSPFVIGGTNGGSSGRLQTMQGYLDEVRLSVGVARSGNTPPTGPYI